VHWQVESWAFEDGEYQSPPWSDGCPGYDFVGEISYSMFCLLAKSSRLGCCCAIFLWENRDREMNSTLERDCSLRPVSGTL